LSKEIIVVTNSSLERRDSSLTRRGLLRWAATGLTAFGGAALLAACGNSGTTSAGGSSSAASGSTSASAASTGSTSAGSGSTASTSAASTGSASTSASAASTGSTSASSSGGGAANALAATPTPALTQPTPTPLPTPVAIAKGSGSHQVLIWHNYTQQDYTNFAKIVDDFVAAHPDFKVNAEYQPTSSGSQENQKLITAIAGGRPPDVAQFDRFIVGSFAFRNALNDLSSLAAKAKITSGDYLPFAWSEASLNGKLYAMPIDTDARALYYRKDQFQQAGITNTPQTPTDLDDVAGKLTEKSSTGYKRIGLIPNMDQGMLYTWGWVWGGSFYDDSTKKVTASNAKVVEALTWMVGYAKKYGEEQMVAFQSAFGSGAQSPFLSGLVAMDPNGNWEIATIKQYTPNLDFGIIAFPHPSGTQPTTWSGGWAWTIPNGAKHVDDGFTVASFLTNQKELTFWCSNTGHFPTLVQALKDPVFSQGDQKLFVDLLPNSHNRPVIPEGNMLWDSLLTATSNAMYGKVSPQDALTAVDTQVNAQLQKDGWFK
jgi:multiple sugar transport system substrate-binding protein